MLSVSRSIPRCHTSSSWKYRGVGQPIRTESSIKTIQKTNSLYVFYRLPILGHRSFFVSTYNGTKATKPSTSFKEKQKQLESVSKKQTKEPPSPKPAESKTKKEKETTTKNVKPKQTVIETKSKSEPVKTKKPATSTQDDEDEGFGITSLKIIAELSSKEKPKVSQSSSKTAKSTPAKPEVKEQPSSAKTKTTSKKEAPSKKSPPSEVKKEETKTTITKSPPKTEAKVSTITKLFSRKEEKPPAKPLQQESIVEEKEEDEEEKEEEPIFIPKLPEKATVVPPKQAVKVEHKPHPHTTTPSAPKKPLIRTLRLEDLEAPKSKPVTPVGRPIPVRVSKIGFRETTVSEVKQQPIVEDIQKSTQQPDQDVLSEPVQTSLQIQESSVDETSIVEETQQELPMEDQPSPSTQQTEDTTEVAEDNEDLEESSSEPAQQKMAPLDETLELDPTLQEHPTPVDEEASETAPQEQTQPKPAHKIIQHPSIPILSNMFQKKEQPQQQDEEELEDEVEEEEEEEDIQVVRFDKQGKRKIPSRKIQNRKKQPKAPKAKMTLSDLLNKGTVSTVTSWHQQQIQQQQQHIKELQERLQRKESGVASDPILASLPSLSDLISNQQSLTELQATLNAKPDVEVDEGITRTTYGQSWNAPKKQPFGGWRKEEKEVKVKPTLEMLLTKGIMTTATHLQPPTKAKTEEGEDEDEDQTTPLSLEDMKVLGSMKYLDWFGQHKLEIEQFQPPSTQTGLFDNLPEDLDVEVQVHGTTHTKTIGRPKARSSDSTFDYQNEEALQTLHDADDPVIRDHDNPHLEYWRQSFPWDDLVQSANQEVFGNSSLRPLQLEAINAAMHNQSMFLSLPTGGGKSLCFWLPAVCSPGLTVVVSPLIALIEDQLHKLRSIGIPATYLSSQLTTTQYKSILDDLYNFDNVHNSNTTKLLYLTPERIGKSGQIIKLLKTLHQQNQLSRIVIDEAHCISEWGHDFRPDYRKLSVFQEKFPDVPITCLTASATVEIVNDILKNLKLQKVLMLQASFDRPNLSYEIREKEEYVVNDIYDYISTKFPHKCGLIYCLTTKDCEVLSKKLNELGLNCAYYHANLSAGQRKKIQLNWMQNNIDVLCTTVAFGMGIDKQDIRFVIHHTMPWSLESYYQQTGRAGRDGKVSDCVMFYRSDDRLRISKVATQEQMERHHMSVVAEKLDDIVLFCEDTQCRRVKLLSHFGEEYEKKTCGNMCDNCRKRNNMQPPEVQ